MQGRVTEWFKVTVLKTVVLKGTASSNLAPSAKKSPPYVEIFYFLKTQSVFTSLKAKGDSKK